MLIFVRESHQSSCLVCPSIILLLIFNFNLFLFILGIHLTRTTSEEQELWLDISDPDHVRREPLRLHRGQSTATESDENRDIEFADEEEDGFYINISEQVGLHRGKDVIKERAKEEKLLIVGIERQASSIAHVCGCHKQGGFINKVTYSSIYFTIL